MIIHLMWGVSWVLISLPLLDQWYEWHALRLRAVASIARGSTGDHKAGEARLRGLQELRPIPLWNIVGSGITAITAFGFPFLQLFLK